MPYSMAILLFFFVLAFQNLEAQNEEMVFHPVGNPLLQQYDIRKIAIGKDGRLWLSADKGLIRFDGSDIHFFGRGEGGTLPMHNQSISRSYFDSRGNLFCVIVWGAIYYLNTKTAKVDYVDIDIPSEDSSQFDKIRPYTELLIDDDKYLWAGRHNMGFVKFDLLNKTTSSFNLHSYPQRNNVSSIQKDLTNDSILWLGTNDGIYSFNKVTGVLKRNFYCSSFVDSSESDLDIFKIHVKDQNTIWFTSAQNGVGSYNIITGQYAIYSLKNEAYNKSYREDDLIYFQYKNPDEYYVGSEKNCPGVFNTRTKEYKFNTRTYQKYPGLNINHVVADSAGNLWSIIFGQLYLAAVNKKKLSTLHLKSGSNGNQLTNIFKTVVWDQKRECYYAAFDNSDEIFVLDSNIQLMRSIPLISSNGDLKVSKEAKVYDIVLDQNGRLWSCGTTLSIYDNRLGKMVPVNKMFSRLDLSHHHFQNIVSRGKHLYLQPSHELSSAIYRINVANYTFDSIVIPSAEALSSTATFESEKKLDVLVVDNAQQYAYFGRHNTVMQVNLKTKQIKVVATVNTKEFQHFFNMYWYLLDDQNNLWINSGDGITIFDVNTLKPIKQITHPQGTYRLQFYNIEGKGIMCVLNSAGIILYDYINNTQHQVSLHDGLITFFNSGIAAVNNTLFVGGELNAVQHIKLQNVIAKEVKREGYVSAIHIEGKPFFGDSLTEHLSTLTLPHDKNLISLTFSTTEFDYPERVEYRYRLPGVSNDWIETNFLNRTVTFNLKPGDYQAYFSIKQKDGSWDGGKVLLTIHIVPAWWQTDRFLIFCVIAMALLVFFLAAWRIKAVRRHEQQKSRIEKELLELEAKALRAQMNPHFIFNCMNSIKSLIQQKNEDKAVSYLTTFSKLLRTILQNSDKREITLYDELETCRLYTQLESMRFDKKFSYHFDIDESADLKSIRVPALIIQPFIENAIWHGIVPKENEGAITVVVKRKGNSIECIIDDNGIGREMSKQNKFTGEASMHQSKGVRLTQTRIDLDNALNQRNAVVEIHDKKDLAGNAIGTTVTLVFTED
jgi:ligand-binding sensor domain-containing protein